QRFLLGQKYVFAAGLYEPSSTGGPSGSSGIRKYPSSIGIRVGMLILNPFQSAGDSTGRRLASTGHTRGSALCPVPEQRHGLGFRNEANSEWDRGALEAHFQGRQVASAEIRISPFWF